MLTEEDKQKIQIWIDKFPKKQGALLMALRIVQDRIGWLPDNALEAVATYLEVPLVNVYEVVSFYTLYRREKGGRHYLKICTGLSCCLSGSFDVIAYFEKNFGVRLGEINDITLLETECLGACDKAPVGLLNDVDYIDSITRQKAKELVSQLQEKTVE